MSCLQLLTSPVLGARTSGSAGHHAHGRVLALWVHHDDEGATACGERVLSYTW